MRHLIKEYDFWGKCSALALWKSSFFHKVPHVRQPKPLLKKLTHISEIQEFHRHLLAPASTKKKGCAQRNWHAGTGQLAAALWVNAASAGCFYHKELQPLCADRIPFRPAPRQLLSQSLWPLQGGERVVTRWRCSLKRRWVLPIAVLPKASGRNQRKKILGHCRASPSLPRNNCV